MESAFTRRFKVEYSQRGAIGDLVVLGASSQVLTPSLCFCAGGVRIIVCGSEAKDAMGIP